MITIVKTELMKLRRYSVVWIGVAAMLSVVLLTRFMATASDGTVHTLENFSNNVIWNNYSIMFPAAITLIAGYIVDRERTDDTLKNILTVPVSFRKLLAGKLLAVGLLSVLLALVEFALTMTVFFMSRYPGFSVLGMLRVLLQMTGMNVCGYIAVLPIIALTAQRSGSFMAGVGFAFFYGFIGTFASGHNLGEIYPITVGLGLIGFQNGGEGEEYHVVLSAGVLLLMLLIAVFLVLTSRNREPAIQKPVQNKKANPERDGEFERRYFWTRTYVQFMLKNEIYVGSMVQGRQYTPSYRSKKREPIPKEDWVVVPDMHEPIVSRELFDEAQKRMGARKKTIKAKDEPDLFAGLFFCEACGTSMLPKVSQQKYFYYNCGRSHAIGQLACSSHYINRDTFHQAVLEDIRRNARLFSEDAEKAAQRLMELKCADQQKQTATMKRDLASAKKRLADLDVKLKRTYEDNMSGKLPDHIFTMFIADYDTERATLKANIAEMEKALEKVRDTKADIDRFAALIRKYTSFEKLDRFMLHELIDRITIYETPGMGRCRKGKEKRITIYYKFVGAIQ